VWFVTSIGTGLQAARAAAGLSQAEAARLAGVNRVALSFYENGQRQPPLRHVVALATAYGVDPGRLFDGVVEPDVAAPEQLLFRSSSVLHAHDVRAQLQRVLRVVEFYTDLLGDLGTSTPVWMASRFTPARGRQTRRYAVAKAREVRRSFGLGETTVADLDALAAEAALVFRAPLGDLDFAPSGLSWLDPTAGFCIIVNSSVRRTHQRFTLAHELAHVLFHLDQPRVAIVSRAREVDDQERFANAFAGELLVPGPALIELSEELQPWERLDDAGTAVRLADRFDVSYAALLVRLRQEKLITPGAYDTLRRASPTAVRDGLGLTPEAPGSGIDDPIEIPPLVYQLARRAFLEGVAGEGAIAEALGIDRERVQRLVRPVDASDEERIEATWFGAVGEFRETPSR
jgi:Zn-dependent peptidase ImmA (M78 family)/transcriptional regulator with XRE-family HTH domain